MDTCPHGSEIKVIPNHTVIFITPCLSCEALLAGLSHESRVVPEMDYALAS